MAAGGYVAVLDMNDENGTAIVSKLGKQTKFFVCNVLETDSIKAAVEGTVAWVKETGKPLAGVIPAAGVSTPATVCKVLLLPCLIGRRGSISCSGKFLTQLCRCSIAVEKQ